MSAGTRNTRQRRAVDALFGEAQRPLGVSEVHVLAGRSVPGIGIATVYRTINAMVEDGSLVTVDVVGQPPQYERSGKSHHHHFQCTDCRRVFDLAGCTLASAPPAPPGFHVRAHSLTLYGACPSCNTQVG